ncbi:Abi-alpha family protein [Amycolatopsis cynarae]|uniref:Abi-alpha family protein n=1 Tax=Amycolatopsis cynarae TaxID=2995223 RepID=A0ABY7B5M8_9PSEU|nr:Abi-alpha family protein [Amycolatopsis sp. HUAS 11-8]WAL66211.1 Abi-alpha family protein [Amycolatopsis sp. HUAS 11-8]
MSREEVLVVASPQDPTLLRRAGRFAGWAARTGLSLTRLLPGAGLAEAGLRGMERQLVSELRKRLDSMDDPYVVTAPARPTAEQRPGDGVLVVAGEPLRAAMKQLMDSAAGFDRAQSREYLYVTVLRQLTPDEARILAVLARGSAFPAVDVLGRGGRVVLRNASTVGKAAGVTLPEEVPSYLTRLAGLGLVEVGPDETALSSQHEILATDEVVREAVRSVKRARLVRHSVRLSRLGARFWAACDPAPQSRVP